MAKEAKAKGSPSKGQALFLILVQLWVREESGNSL
jgi:hypothetical protein